MADTMFSSKQRTKQTKTRFDLHGATAGVLAHCCRPPSATFCAVTQCPSPPSDYISSHRDKGNLMQLEAG